ncbi:MAG TPA: sugar transferase [Candidatus Binatia bacterium]|nr:sugar transferase [Candidatus Binatia bacterium]
MTALEALQRQLQAAPPAPVMVEPLPERRFGRFWQLAVAALGFLFLLPVSVIIAIAIKLTSRGPILYRGTRIGRGMEPFTIYKFRTLLIDAEQRIGARLVTATDPLYTPVGRFLRRYKLDEIPQLLNVVRGDMNMVGPRPVRPVFLATSVRDIPNYSERFRIRPGMTGLAQLRGGYFTHPRDKLRYDRIYIARRGFWLDFKLVVATFVKLLNRWLTLGVLLGLIFLCASFVPAVFSAPFQISVGGFNLSPFEATGLFLATVVLVRQIPGHRLYLYRTPTNRPMVCFLVFSLLAGLLAGDLGARLRDVAYFTASGFLLFFLVVSGEITEEFATRATRVVALAAVAVALLGIFEVVVQNHVSAALGPDVGTVRIAATLGSPVALAAYLVLGMPLVLVELVCAEGREERDFWLVCSTLVIVGIVLTQTRTGLVALWLTGSIFAWRVSRPMFRLFAGASLVFLMMMVWMGGLRLSPGSIREEWERRASVTRAAVESEAAAPLGVLLGPEPGKGAISLVEENAGGHHRVLRNANMHLTLVQRTGVVGWGLMMWVIGSALVAICRGSAAVTDRKLALLLWAIFSSGLGFLVSMSNFNAFYDAPIQIFFWGLLGIGMAIVVHQSGRRPAFNVIWRFGPRD